MDYQDLNNQLYDIYNDKAVKGYLVRNFVNQVEKYFIEAKKEKTRKLQELFLKQVFTSKDIIKSFFQKKSETNTTSKMSDFANTKAILLKYLEILQKENIIENTNSIIEYVKSLDIGDVFSKKEFMKKWYKDTNDLINSIDRVCEYYYTAHIASGKNLAPFNCRTNLLHIKTIAILLWKGIKSQEMLEIKAKDICYITDENCYIQLKKNVKIPLTMKEFQILYDYIMADKYYSISDWKLRKYKQSKRLIKFSREANNDSIRHQLQDYNNLSLKTPVGRILFQPDIFQCGMFVRAHEKMKGSSLTAAQSYLTTAKGERCTKFKAVHEFKAWLSIFYPEEK